MEYRVVGESGLVVSTIGLGCGSFGRRADEGPKKLLTAAESRRTIEAAFDAGVTLYDTSDSYGDGEIVLGKALAAHRDEVVIATKFGNRIRGGVDTDHGARGSRRYVRLAVERSLRRLGTDRIDLYQMHSPDGSTPIDETLGVLTDLVREGKVRYLGSSKLTAWEITEAAWTSRTAGLEHFVSAQNHYSLVARKIEDDIIPACRRYGVGVIPLRPLANGLLTGKYQPRAPYPEVDRPPRDLVERSADVLDALDGFARERDLSMAAVALGGLLAMPGVAAVIPGATSPAQAVANVQAGTWKPSTDDLALLTTITRHGPWPQDPAGSWPNVGSKWIGPKPPGFEGRGSPNDGAA